MTTAGAASGAPTGEYPTPDRGVVRDVVASVRELLASVPNLAGMTDEDLHGTVGAKVATVLSSARFRAVAGDARLAAAVMDDLLGFGPLQDLIADGLVSEIMVNGPDSVFVETGGLVRHTGRTFESHDQLMRVIDRMLRTSGRRVDQSSPMVDARLPDGSRLNVILPPLAVDGPSVTIRKFLSNSLTTGDLVDTGCLSADAADFLKEAVSSRMNILVSGGTGTGKTTVLNILSSFIGRAERVVTIEDAVELTLHMDNLVRLESRPANAEGAGEVSIRDLVRNALRMRPDRIVVGEVRGSETIDMLQAMNTGHEGSLSTVHANSPRDALRRVETMVLLSGADLPLRAVREQVASAIDLVVHLTRDAHGRRLVTHVTEIAGMEGELVSTADLFMRDVGGPTGDGPPPLVSSGLASRRLGARRVDRAR